MIVNKRKLVFEDLDMYEERSRRYWDQRLDEGVGDLKRMKVDPLDANMEDELKELMKGEQPTDILSKDIDHPNPNPSAAVQESISSMETETVIAKPSTDFKSGTEETPENSNSVPEAGTESNTHDSLENPEVENSSDKDRQSPDPDESVTRDDGQEFQPLYE